MVSPIDGRPADTFDTVPLLLGSLAVTSARYRPGDLGALRGASNATSSSDIGRGPIVSVRFRPPGVRDGTSAAVRRGLDRLEEGAVCAKRSRPDEDLVLIAASKIQLSGSCA